MNRWIVIFVSKHEEEVSVLGPYETETLAFEALKKDVEETANGWEGVDASEVDFNVFYDGTAYAAYEDEKFFWKIEELRLMKKA